MTYSSERTIQNCLLIAPTVHGRQSNGSLSTYVTPQKMNMLHFIAKLHYVCNLCCNSAQLEIGRVFWMFWMGTISSQGSLQVEDRDNNESVRAASYPLMILHRKKGAKAKEGSWFQQVRKGKINDLGDPRKTALLTPPFRIQCGLLVCNSTGQQKRGCKWLRLWSFVIMTIGN